MRPPPTRIGNGGRYFRTNASMGPESTSSDTPAISKSLRSNSPYSSAMCGSSSRQGSHHDAQKFTSVTLPRNAASLTVSPARSGSASAGPNASRVLGAAPSARATSESASNTARTPLASTATAVSWAPRCRVARIAPVAGSSTSTRRRVAAESSDPSAYGHPARTRGVQRRHVRALPFAHHAAVPHGVDHHALAGVLGDQQLRPAERRHGHRRGEARVRDLADDAELAIEREEPTMLGIGRP